jgi:hypothetical protein
VNVGNQRAMGYLAMAHILSNSQREELTTRACTVGNVFRVNWPLAVLTPLPRLNANPLLS